MNMQGQIERYLWRSGWVRQSVERVLRDLPRWERHLRSRGITEIPHRGSRSWSPTKSRADNELNLLMRQAARDRDASIEHQLRNLTRIRQPKP